MNLVQRVLMCALSIKLRITKTKARILIHVVPNSYTKHMILIFSWSTGHFLITNSKPQPCSYRDPAIDYRGIYPAIKYYRGMNSAINLYRCLLAFNFYRGSYRDPAIAYRGIAGSLDRGIAGSRYEHGCG
jgi:hypothetical protein